MEIHIKHNDTKDWKPGSRKHLHLHALDNPNKGIDFSYRDFDEMIKSGEIKCKSLYAWDWNGNVWVNDSLR